MKGVNLLELVRKRHDGDGWLVFTELGNKPGTYADRYADAFALGVWASKKYEAHLFEIKISREDVKRELRDPTKVEGVGKYATHWWLVISNQDIIRDIVVPEAWGILMPATRGGSTMLTVLRKAPKQTPHPFSPMFAISLVRNMAKNYKSNADYERLREERDAALEKREPVPLPTDRAKDSEIAQLKRELAESREGIRLFKEETGVDLTAAKWPYDFKHMGRAFNLAQNISHALARGEFGDQVGKLSRAAQMMESSAQELAETAVAMRALMPGSIDAVSDCQAARGRGALCVCGAHGRGMSDVERKLLADARERARPDPPPPPDDDPGSRIDRGGAGEDVEDAGPVVRDLGDEVSHGIEAS